MAIKSNVTADNLSNYLNKVSEILRDEIVRAFSYLGEQAVSKARLPHEGNWNDITGNLRSSIGYTVYEQGKVQIQSAFDLVKNGTQGQAEGKRIVEELAQRYTNTYVLIVAAGMNYASLVEARENRDVLASAELFANSKLNEYIQKSVERAFEKADKLKLCEQTKR